MRTVCRTLALHPQIWGHRIEPFALPAELQALIDFFGGIDANHPPDVCATSPKIWGIDLNRSLSQLSYRPIMNFCCPGRHAAFCGAHDSNSMNDYSISGTFCQAFAPSFFWFCDFSAFWGKPPQTACPAALSVVKWLCAASSQKSAFAFRPRFANTCSAAASYAAPQSSFTLNVTA